MNSTLGWWWADAGGALVIAGIAVREGFNAWRGDACCAVPHAESQEMPRAGDDTSSGQGTDACCSGCASPEPQSLGLTIRSKS